MKRILSSALALVLLIGTANAQDDRKGKHKGAKAGQDMAAKGADLTAEQRNRVKTINEAYRKDIAELKTQSLPADQMKVKREALQTEHAADIKAVLTQEQKNRIGNARAGRQDKGVDRRDTSGRNAKGQFKKGPQSERRGEIAADLNLSSDQQEKMQSIRSTYKGRFEAIQHDTSLSKEVKREKMKELMKAQQEEMKSVLSAEQQSKMKGIRRDAVKRRK